jgi:diguanylate cyclase (GGDEF)-like protein
MGHPLRLLIVDAQQPAAELAAHQLTRAGYPCTWRRVETEAEFRSELGFGPDLILSEFALPQYDGLAALAFAAHHAPHVPFIFLSATAGDSHMVQALACGAADYVPKAEITRLVPSVARVLNRSAPGGAPGHHLHHLAAVLQSLSRVRAAALARPSCVAFLDEVCRILEASGRYAYCFVAVREAHSHTVRVVASAGAGAEGRRGARFSVASRESEDTSVVGRVLRSGETVLCPALDAYGGALAECERTAAAGRGSAFVALPLAVGSDAIGTLTVGTAEATWVDEAELLLLQELSRQISDTLVSLPDGDTVRPLALDPLTGLQLRGLFCDRIAERLRGAPVTDGVVVVVFNVERLRDINDVYGRQIGDRLLQRVAERLRDSFGGSADLAHFGAGTFAAVFSERRSGPLQTNDPARAAFSQPFAVAGRNLVTVVRRGLARYPADGADGEGLLRHAEAALETLRARGPAHAPAGAPEPRAREAEERLRLAFARHEFLLYYQPLIERVSGQVIAVEALLRWRDPERGLLSPGAFLQVLERTSLILPVGEWVLGQALHDSGHWQTAGLPRLRMAVNVSSAELGRRDFARDFLRKIQRVADGAYIDIEVDEGSLREAAPRLRQTFRTLRGEGVHIAIDHFGVAAGALRRLDELPVDSVKIDRSFISHLTDRPQSQAQVSGIIAFARSRGLRTVAEGVESVEQLKILDELGCEQSQGYLHSPALGARDLEILIALRSSAAALQ